MSDTSQAPTPEVAAVLFDEAELYSVVVHSSGAPPIVMSGIRDVAQQDKDLSELFNIPQ